MSTSFPPLDYMELPSSAEIILPNGMESITLEDREEKEEAYESLWTDKEPLKVDWDKPICPEHKVACKGKLCTVMAKIERDKKREEEKAKGGGNDDGWNSVKGSKNRGRKSKTLSCFISNTQTVSTGGRGGAYTARGGKSWGRGLVTNMLY